MREPSIVIATPMIIGSPDWEKLEMSFIKMEIFLQGDDIFIRIPPNAGPTVFATKLPAPTKRKLTALTVISSQQSLFVG